MKKLHKLVVLPLNRKPKLHDIVFSNKYFFISDGADIHFARRDESKPQQLLLISDSFNTDMPINIAYYDGIGNIRSFGTGNTYNFLSKNILASYPSMDSLPTFSETFIKEWINNPVMIVEIQYSEDNCLLITPNNQVICFIPKKDDLINDADFKEGDRVYQEEKDIKLYIDSYTPCATYDLEGIRRAITNTIDWYKDYLKQKELKKEEDRRCITCGHDDGNLNCQPMKDRLCDPDTHKLWVPKDEIPDVNFRKQIAEELSRDELIDRLCEYHERLNSSIHDQMIDIMNEDKDIKKASIDYANKVMPESVGAMKNMLAEVYKEGIKWYKEYKNLK